MNNPSGRYEIVAPADTHEVFTAKCGHLTRYTLAQLVQTKATTPEGARIYANLIEPFEGPGVQEADYIVVRPMPFGNDASNRNQRLQSRVLSEVVGQPVVSVSAPSKTGKFTRSPKVAQGDFSPLAMQTITAAREMSVLHGSFMERIGKLAYFGWSQGATLALECAAQNTDSFDIQWLAAGEPVNVMCRSPLALLRDMGKADAHTLFEALEASTMRDLFLDAYEVPLDGKKALEARFVRRINSSVLDSFKGSLLQQGDIIKGFGKPLFSSQLQRVMAAAIPSVIASAKESAMSPVDELDGAISAAVAPQADLEEYVYRLLFAEATHVHGDHMPTIAYMARSAIAHASNIR